MKDTAVPHFAPRSRVNEQGGVGQLITKDLGSCVEVQMRGTRLEPGTDLKANNLDVARRLIVANWKLAGSRWKSWRDLGCTRCDASSCCWRWERGRLGMGKHFLHTHRSSTPTACCYSLRQTLVAHVPKPRSATIFQPCA